MKFVDSQSNEYVFSNTFFITDLSIQRRSKLFERSFAHGAVDGADDKYGVRVVVMRGIISGETDAEFRTAWENLKTWLAKSDLKLYFNSDSRFVNVKKIRSISEPYRDGLFFRYAEIMFECLCLDPFIYEATETQVQENITGSPQAINVTNSGNVEVFPEITIVPSADNFDLTLKNTSDDNRLFRYQDTFFENGDTLVVDCKIGTVQRNSVNTIHNFTGSFLRLLPGANSLEYTGANGTITIKFRNRYI